MNDHSYQNCCVFDRVRLPAIKYLYCLMNLERNHRKWKRKEEAGKKVKEEAENHLFESFWLHHNGLCTPQPGYVYSVASNMDRPPASPTAFSHVRALLCQDDFKFVCQSCF
eukprot:EG_transcript_50186